MINKIFAYATVVELYMLHFLKMNEKNKKCGVKTRFPKRSSGTCECFPESIISYRRSSLMSKSLK